MDSEQNTFIEGQRVRHKVFGEGTVIEVDMDHSAYLVQFDGMDTPRGIAFRAKMEVC